MDMETSKKQNRRVTIFACLLSIVSIGLLVFGFFLVSSDKVVLLQSISNLSNKLNKVLDDKETLIDKIAVSDNVGIRSKIGISCKELNANLNLNYLENQTDKKSHLISSLSINNEEVLDLDLALASDNAYLFVDNITDNYINTSFQYLTIFSNLESDDYDKLINLVRNSITDYLDNGDIKKEKALISYNGKDKKVNKLSYRITNETIKNIVTNFINSLKKDKDLMKKIADYLKITNKELEDNLLEIVNSLEYEEKIELYDYIVYYYGFNKIVGYELVSVKTKATVEYKIQGKEEINVYNNSKQIAKLEIIKGKKQFDFNGYIVIDDNNKKINISGMLIDDDIDLNFEFEDIKLKFDINNTTEEKENTLIDTTNIIVFNVSSNKNEQLMSIDINNEYYVNEIINVDFTNSININDMTEEDFNLIYNKISNHPIYNYLTEILNEYDIGFDDKDI